jgi:hypothetical protein
MITKKTTSEITLDYVQEMYPAEDSGNRVWVYFEELKKEINNTELSDLYREKLSIYCNDCEKKSDTYFHYKGNMCMYCNSFNTKKI